MIRSLLDKKWRRLILFSFFLLFLMPNSLTGNGDTCVIPRLEASVTGFVGQSEKGPLNQPTLVTSFAEFTSIFGMSVSGLDNPHLAPSIYAYFSNGGEAAYIVRVADASDAELTGYNGGTEKTGLQTLLDVDDISAISIPGATSVAVQTAMIAYCTQSQKCLAILDPASANDIPTIEAQRTALNTTYGYATLYYPWIHTVYDGKDVILPPSGYAAGVIAKTRANDAPAGPTAGSLVWATGLTDVINTEELDSLVIHDINPILDINAVYTIWGARTLAEDMQWRYITVRREANVIKKSVYAGTTWCLEESNDEVLWIQLQSCIDNFMYDLFREGWFQGTSPDDAYFVKVGTETMTQTDINEGRTIMIVGFAPMKPAEFVLLDIVQDRSAASKDQTQLQILPAIQMLLND